MVYILFLCTLFCFVIWLNTNSKVSFSQYLSVNIVQYFLAQEIQSFAKNEGPHLGLYCWWNVIQYYSSLLSLMTLFQDNLHEDSVFSCFSKFCAILL